MSMVCIAVSQSHWHQGYSTGTYSAVDENCLAVDEPVADQEQDEGSHIGTRSCSNGGGTGLRRRLSRRHHESLFVKVSESGVPENVCVTRCAHLRQKETYRQRRLSGYSPADTEEVRTRCDPVDADTQRKELMRERRRCMSNSRLRHHIRN